MAVMVIVVVVMVVVVMVVVVVVMASGFWLLAWLLASGFWLLASDDGDGNHRNSSQGRVCTVRRNLW